MVLQVPPNDGIVDLSIPPIRFAQARGARLAYQDFGDGPATVVAVPPLAQNIEAAWEWPAMRSMFERFASFSRWVCFDKRGTGASDRRVRVPGIDERVDDFRAVMDAAEIDRAFIYGASEGGPMALLFAVTYPERVEGIILHGSGAHSSPVNLSADELAAIRKQIRVSADKWGTSESPFPAGLAPSWADDPEFLAWHERYERVATDSDSLYELMDISFFVDMRSILPQIRVPTLVLQATGDRIVPVEYGREAAEGIPGAVLIEYESDNHLPCAGNLEWLDHLERFTTGTVAPTRPHVRARSAHITTLGRFAVTVDGAEVPASSWGSRRARQLCKRLVAARGWPVSREQLFEQLWPDETDIGKLGARLSVQLSTVRRVLGGGINATRESVALDLSEVSTDLEALFTAKDGTVAVGLYGGEFLPDDHDEPWAETARAAARAATADLVRSTAAALRSDERHRDAADLLRRIVAIDRYDDLAHELLVSCLLDAGDVAAARDAHDERVRAMAELDIDVTPFSGG
jgi:pimeloyl-ACP methyl ester carboxylesterase/DNA-binding SARP family transcriptional activator